MQNQMKFYLGKYLSFNSAHLRRELQRKATLRLKWSSRTSLRRRLWPRRRRLPSARPSLTRPEVRTDKLENTLFPSMNIEKDLGKIVVWGRRPKTLELLELLLLFLDFSFDLCLINFHHHATPNFLNIINYISIYPSIHQAVFFLSFYQLTSCIP